MSTTSQTAATIDDLYRVEGKAELIGGRIVRFRCPAAGSRFRVALRIVQEVSTTTPRRPGVGVAYADGLGYALDPPLPNGRQSFSPDASYYVGPHPRNRMRFITGAPTFAVEVRSEGDRGPAAEAEMAAKRRDYFEAGTVVVWDVDPVRRKRSFTSYRKDAADQPVTFSERPGRRRRAGGPRVAGRGGRAFSLNRSAADLSGKGESRVRITRYRHLSFRIPPPRATRRIPERVSRRPCGDDGRDEPAITTGS